MMNLDSIVRIGGVTASVGTFVRLGKLRLNADGVYLTVGSNPHPPYLLPPSPPYVASLPAPNSLEDLQQRGFRVMRGKTPECDRVEIGGAYFRISAAIANGLI